MFNLIKRYWKKYFSIQYRIVKDNYAGYECQSGLFNFFWVETGGTNTYRSIEQALDFIYKWTGREFEFKNLNEKLNEKH